MDRPHMGDELEAIITKLADVLKPAVLMIEVKPQTSQNNYGEYLAILPMLVSRFGKQYAPEHQEKLYFLFAAALVDAGANKQGVTSALALLGKI